jgi:CDP-paratose 2-epimerase
MRNHGMRRILITGGAGFIGSNLAERLLQTPKTHVRIYDNLSRAGVTCNLAWLESMAKEGSFEFVEGDVRNLAAITAAVSDVDEIYHFAAQVAVTTSLQDPLMDFQVNALGTVNVLEAVRLSGRKPFVLFTSTNKVYGALDSVPVVCERTRYRARDKSFKGVNESQPVDFHSPYGCSKGTADQYVRDYARIFQLPTVVFRMSCIASPHQLAMRIRAG